VNRGTCARGGGLAQDWAPGFDGAAPLMMRGLCRPDTHAAAAAALLEAYDSPVRASPCPLHTHARTHTHTHSVSSAAQQPGPALRSAARSRKPLNGAGREAAAGAGYPQQTWALTKRALRVRSCRRWTPGRAHETFAPQTDTHARTHARTHAQGTSLLDPAQRHVISAAIALLPLLLHAAFPPRSRPVRPSSSPPPSGPAAGCAQIPARRLNKRPAWLAMLLAGPGAVRRSDEETSAAPPHAAPLHSTKGPIRVAGTRRGVRIPTPAFYPFDRRETAAARQRRPAGRR
jgi:hypothetical protein